MASMIVMTNVLTVEAAVFVRQQLPDGKSDAIHECPTVSVGKLIENAGLNRPVRSVKSGGEAWPWETIRSMRT